MSEIKATIQLGLLMGVAMAVGMGVGMAVGESLDEATSLWFRMLVIGLSTGAAASVPFLVVVVVSKIFSKPNDK